MTAFNRPGKKSIKLVVLLAVALIVVFTLVNRAAAPAGESEVSDEAERTVEENGTVDTMPPPPAPPTASCGEKNSVCKTSDDCCGNLGLECQDVRTSTGGFGKRCLPVEVQVCRSDCENGVWGTPRACKPSVAPDSMVSCESFVGDECKTSVHSDRNTRECWDT